MSLTTAWIALSFIWLPSDLPPQRADHLVIGRVRRILRRAGEAQQFQLPLNHSPAPVILGSGW
ncbi:hypothetical protein V6L77_00770 [Pannonibacter sp. Pt2-lr]